MLAVSFDLEKCVQADARPVTGCLRTCAILAPLLADVFRGIARCVISESVRPLSSSNQRMALMGKAELCFCLTPSRSSATAPTS